MPATSVCQRFCLFAAGRLKGAIGEAGKVSRPCLHARMTRYPSLASAGVAEDSAGSGRSLSVGIRAKIEGIRAAEKSAALFCAAHSVSPACRKHPNLSPQTEDHFRTVSRDRLTSFVGVSWPSRSSADTMHSEYG